MSHIWAHVPWLRDLPCKWLLAMVGECYNVKSKFLELDKFWTVVQRLTKQILEGDEWPRDSKSITELLNNEFMSLKLSVSFCTIERYVSKKKKRPRGRSHDRLGSEGDSGYPRESATMSATYIEDAAALFETLNLESSPGAPSRDLLKTYQEDMENRVPQEWKHTTPRAKSADRLQSETSKVKDLWEIMAEMNMQRYIQNETLMRRRYHNKALVLSQPEAQRRQSQREFPPSPLKQEVRTTISIKRRNKDADSAQKETKKPRRSARLDSKSGSS